MITGCIHINLSKPPREPYGNHDRRALIELEHAPDGARVVIDIGRRRLFEESVYRDVNAHDGRLLIEVLGRDSRAVADFVTAARAGTWQVVR